MKKENKHQKQRKEAIKWWNTLLPEQKKSFFSVYKLSNFTPSVNYTTLTGREIQKIQEQNIGFKN